jgi:hypothetical protein
MRNFKNFFLVFFLFLSAGAVFAQQEYSISVKGVDKITTPSKKGKQILVVSAGHTILTIFIKEIKKRGWAVTVDESTFFFKSKMISLSAHGGSSSRTTVHLQGDLERQEKIEIFFPKRGLISIHHNEVILK